MAIHTHLWLGLASASSRLRLWFWWTGHSWCARWASSLGASNQSAWGLSLRISVLRSDQRAALHRASLSPIPNTDKMEGVWVSPGLCQAEAGDTVAVWWMRPPEVNGAREVGRQTGLWSRRPGQLFPLIPASVYPSCKMGIRLPPLGGFSEMGWLKSGKSKGSGEWAPPLTAPWRECLAFWGQISCLIPRHNGITLSGVGRPKGINPCQALRIACRTQ